MTPTELDLLARVREKWPEVMERLDYSVFDKNIWYFEVRSGLSHKIHDADLASLIIGRCVVKLHEQFGTITMIAGCTDGTCQLTLLDGHIQDFDTPLAAYLAAVLEIEP